MPSIKLLFAVMTVGSLLITGCASNAVLSEATPQEAHAFGARGRLGNPGLLFGDIAGDTSNTFWTQTHVAAGILANDPGVEKFEEGTVKAQLMSGETISGTFLGYRPRKAEHCTRSWIANLYYFDTRVSFRRAGGVAVLKGDQGTALLCTYDWSGPGCRREGVCSTKEGKYYTLEF